MEWDPKAASEGLAWDWRPGWRRWVSGKASCNSSCVIDATGYFDCHFLNYVFVWGEEGGFALRFFCFVFCFQGAWVDCFGFFSFLNENLPQRENQQHWSSFQSQEGLEYYFPPSEEALNGGKGTRALERDLVFLFVELLEDIKYLA